MQKIFIHEVGSRDGLQVEKLTVALEEKIHWTESLFASCIDIVQLESFVHPEKVPEVADLSAKTMRRIKSIRMIYCFDYFN
jgi:hydroxymethylglutaryl-CoA lyase